MLDDKKLKQLTGIVDIVLSYDLEKLRQEDDVKRVGFYNQIVANENSFTQEHASELQPDFREYTLGQFSFAKLRLAAAEKMNGEQTGITESFNAREVALVATFDKYNTLDMRTPEELAEKMRRETNISNLAQQYQNEYQRLDSILDDPQIRKDLKVFLKKQYKNRLKNVNDGIQVYIGKYGPNNFVELLGNSKATSISDTPTFEAIDDEKAKKQKIAEKLEQITEASGGKLVRLIFKEDARKCELDFIARFDTKMNKFPIKFYSPIEKKTFEIRKWGPEEHIIKSERTVPDIPWNTRSSYIVSERKHGWLGGKVHKVVIEAVSLNHLDEFEQFGFDSNRANLAEVLNLVTSLIDTAELGKYLHIIGISSPTGWEEKLTEEFKSNGIIRNYLSRYVSFCLIDSITGEVFYNTSDERIARPTEFFKPEFDNEKIDKVTKYIIGRLAGRSYVVFQDVMNETNESRQIINKVFYDLQKTGKY